MWRGYNSTEFPIGARPIPQLFPVRNRLISGLALGALVVEAGVQSSALITVRYALEQGRDVFAILGPIFSPKSMGSNQLIRDGAGLVTQAQDILEALNLSVAAIQQEVQAASAQTRPRPRCSSWLATRPSISTNCAASATCPSRWSPPPWPCWS